MKRQNEKITASRQAGAYHHDRGMVCTEKDSFSSLLHICWVAIPALLLIIGGCTTVGNGSIGTVCIRISDERHNPVTDAEIILITERRSTVIGRSDCYGRGELPGASAGPKLKILIRHPDFVDHPEMIPNPGSTDCSAVFITLERISDRVRRLYRQEEEQGDLSPAENPQDAPAIPRFAPHYRLSPRERYFLALLQLGSENYQQAQLWASSVEVSCDELSAFKAAVDRILQAQ
ncbi:hypothetical protein [Salinispira pacifica]|uniref:Uncharacterized protein n=1 Tax=Salinispira pacifica TaxID=1307761 RepID=V5WEF9_9SPIO|nr:hypothetical protein [Salinispira pacifica]AHC13536.1 hypothetical protein L21SP2_0092 [Salinispira pacifica]